MVDEADRINTMDLHCQLNVFQDHLVIVHAAGQRDDIEIIIPKPDRDPWLQEFLQTVIHAVDHRRVAVDDRLLLLYRCHGGYKISPSLRFRKLPSPRFPSH